MKIVIVLPLEKETKNTVRYGRQPTDARDSANLCSQVYLQKSALPTPYPKEITLTVESPE